MYDLFRDRITRADHAVVEIDVRADDVRTLVPARGASPSYPSSCIGRWREAKASCHSTLEGSKGARACALSCSSRSPVDEGRARGGRGEGGAAGVASGGVEKWAFSGEDAFVRCRTWLGCRGGCRGTLTGGWNREGGGGRKGRRKREAQWWRFSGGRNGRPGQCKPGCLPDDTVALLGCRGNLSFFFSARKAEGLIYRSYGRRQFPLSVSLFHSFSSLSLSRAPPACTSVGSCRIEGRKSGRATCAKTIPVSTCTRAKRGRGACSRDRTRTTLPCPASWKLVPLTSNRLVL